DGILDSSVTGVQTCALPISSLHPSRYRLSTHDRADGRLDALPGACVESLYRDGCSDDRSRDPAHLAAPGTCHQRPDLRLVLRREIGRASWRERAWEASAVVW